MKNEESVNTQIGEEEERVSSVSCSLGFKQESPNFNLIGFNRS